MSTNRDALVERVAEALHDNCPYPGVRGVDCPRCEPLAGAVLDALPELSEAHSAESAALAPGVGVYDCVRCGHRVMRLGIETNEGWFHAGCHRDDEIQRRRATRVTPPGKADA